MNIIKPHIWTHNVDEARDIQLWLRSRVKLDDRFNIDNKISNIIWCSATYDYTKWPEVVYAVANLYKWPSFNCIGSGYGHCEPTIPAINDVISFRNVPPMLMAINNVIQITGIEPNMIICDGEGIAHPNRFGTASHIGILTDKTTIGVTTSTDCVINNNDILMQEEIYVVNNDITKKIGFIMDDIKYPSLVGKVLNGYYISPGHMITVDSALAVMKHVFKKSPDILDVTASELDLYMKMNEVYDG